MNMIVQTHLVWGHNVNFRKILLNISNNKNLVEKLPKNKNKLCTNELVYSCYISFDIFI